MHKRLNSLTNVAFSRTPGSLFIGALSLFLLLPHAYAQDSFPKVPGSLDEVEKASQRRRLPTTQSQTVTAAPEDLTEAKLAPGYLLEMEVYDTPEMSTSLRVDQDGNVSVPLVGSVHVAGDTVLQAQNAIAQALVNGEILKSPQVTLNISQYSSNNATVLGEVMAPGRVQLLAPRTLGDVLALAGGETTAAGTDIDIQHKDAGSVATTTRIKYSPTLNVGILQQTTIYPGDTVIVQRAGAIYILGAVTKPGAYLMVNGGGLNLLEAISLAEGTILRASVSYAEIMRPNGDTYTRFKVPLSKMQKGKVDPTRLQVNDIVYIPVSGTKSVFIDGANILGAAVNATAYAAR